jgi:putative membrane protein
MTNLRLQRHLLLLLMFLGMLIWSGYEPKDRLTWLLEVAPALIGAVLMIVTYARFPLTGMAYVLVWFHAAILLIGGHYTYGEMPLFNWLRDIFDLDRNYYDRLGHIFQGFVPAIITREILLRLSPLRSGKWLFFLVTCVCLAISAFYEILEMLAAKLSDDGAVAFLATQGDVWDTQWDMFFALGGALAALILLSHWHDRQLRKLTQAS